MRAKLLDIPIVLGSATPSFESFERATAGRYQLLVLPQRVEARPLPTVQVVDLRHCAASERLLSPPLAAAIEHRLQAGEQALLFLNRRGFYTTLLCEDCGSTSECPYCSIALTYHARQDRLRCHVCGFARKPPSACRQCRGTHLRYFGIGTQQVEDAVRKRFPHARVARLDRDTAEGWRGLDAILRRLAEGAIDILVGTQMIGKGHDVPNVTLVGVISADTALALPDFHVGERAFSLLTQVVGRAGRGDKPGLALIQTFRPDHAVLRAVQTQDYTALWQTESAHRQQQALPPFTRAILAVLSSADAAATEAAAGEFVRCLETAGVTPRCIKGPAPAPLYKVRTRYRWQVLIHEADARRLHEHLRRATQHFAQTQLARTVRIDLDVDPATIA
jgi:primosomal protein N' (replication factor Y)